MASVREHLWNALEACRDFVAARPRTAVGVGVAIALLLVTPLIVDAVAVRALRSRAQAMGIDVDVGGASLGFGKVTFRGVSIRSRQLPGVQAELTSVAVYPGATLGPRRVDVMGGSVRLQGSASALEDDVAEWRRAHGGKTGADASPGAAAMPLHVSGIDLQWRDDDDELVAWGLRYDRDERDGERLGGDLVRATQGGKRVEAVHGQMTLTRQGGSRLLTGASVERLNAVYDMDLSPRAATGVVVRPVAPRDDDSERGPRLRARLHDVATKLAAFLPAAQRVEVSGVYFELRHGGQSLNVGPATVVVEKQTEAMRLALSSGQGEGREPLRFDTRLPLGEGSVDVSLSGGPLRLDALGVNEHDMGLMNVADSELEATGSARLSSDGRSLSVSGRGHLSNLSIHQPKLARNPVRNLSVSLAGKLGLALDGSATTLENVEVGLGKARLEISGNLARSEGHAAGSFHVEAPLTACSDVLASAPSALVPLLGGLGLSGTFTFSGDLAFDTRRPADAKVDFTGANDCHVTQVPASLSLDRFRRPWQRIVRGQTGLPTTIESGPGTRSWVPYSEISSYMATAVVICEDARFFAHGGFDAKSIQSSIRDNLREGRFVRGASTVSMQLAKNLYLEREKTLSRKLQEAVLTLLLEQSLTKEEILELYFNIVEFAPGLYGIGPAAAHYFHSTPRNLSLGQALYLASILPNPKVQHFGTDGLLRPQWADYLRKLMKIAHKIHRIDDRELEIGLEETVQLGVAATADAFLRQGSDEDDEHAPEPAGP